MEPKDNKDIRWQVYIIHFNKPYKHARHYIGIALNAKERFEQHKKGNGARLTEIVVKNGIGLHLNIIKEFDDFTKAHLEEKRLKRWKKGARHCPICKKERG